MRVRNMTSKRGNSVLNQYIIYMENEVYFQSYNNMIAKKSYEGDAVELQNGYWDNYSATTNKYLNRFLGTSGIAEIREKVKNGEFEVGDI